MTRTLETGLQREPPDQECAATTAPVHKRLIPGQNGTKRYQEEYGNALVCVRYRQLGDLRFTTVELVVDQREARRKAEGASDAPDVGAERVLVKLHLLETLVRADVKRAGGVWNKPLRAWEMTRAAAVGAGVQGRIVAVWGTGPSGGQRWIFRDGQGRISDGQG